MSTFPNSQFKERVPTKPEISEGTLGSLKVPHSVEMLMPFAGQGHMSKRDSRVSDDRTESPGYDAQHRESFNLQTPNTRWEMALTIACLRKVCNDGQSHRYLVLSQPMLHKDLKCTKLLHQCLLSTLSLALRKHQSLFPKVVRCWTREGERKKAPNFFFKG